ncbi:MAG: PDDEXK nuclease domain-containing protein [Verrucomicrobiota bacterium]
MKKKAASKKVPVKAVSKRKEPIRHNECGELSVAPAVPLFDRVATILDSARSSVVRAVNSRMVLAYWLIGREIVQDLQGGDDRAAYGKRVIADLSKQFAKRYGQGYSGTNLRQFRQFYQVFSDRAHSFPALQNQIYHALRDKSPAVPEAGNEEPQVPIDHAARDQSLTKSLEAIFSPLETRPHETKPAFHPSLCWTHYRTLMQVEKPDARDFYENETIAAGWNTRELERQIHSLYYERLLLSKDKQGMIREQRTAAPAYDPTAILKSSTVLEFLGLPDSPRLHESRLEQAIMDNLQTFLLELGRGFSFVARQRRLQFGDEEFYVDLVFYNYLLKCFVLIDLKMGKLTHQDIGQMDGYVRMYEDLYKVAGDNPTIGLILCTEKSRTIARYSVLQESQQLFASKYRLHLPTEEELAAELKREVLAIQERREG